MKIKEKAKSLKFWIPTLFLVMKREDTPLISKIFAIGTVCYALSPIDLIPDFIPILGYLDDIIILPLMIKITLKLTPEYIIKECFQQAANILKNDNPKKWIYALPIIIIWLIILYFVIDFIMKKYF
jgi:uncharacterized membrane protein YkvA (DUF1232 family)